MNALREGRLPGSTVLRQERIGLPFRLGALPRALFEAAGMKEHAILKNQGIMRLNGALAYLALGVGCAVLHGWTPHPGACNCGLSPGSTQARTVPYSLSL